METMGEAQNTFDHFSNWFGLSQDDFGRKKGFVHVFGNGLKEWSIVWEEIRFKSFFEKIGA